MALRVREARDSSDVTVGSARDYLLQRVDGGRERLMEEGARRGATAFEVVRGNRECRSGETTLHSNDLLQPRVGVDGNQRGGVKKGC